MKKLISLLLIFLVLSAFTLTTALTAEATPGIKIKRFQLYFKNRRAEITIKKNQPSLKAVAEIKFTGSGLLQGYWDIDGRILNNVNRHIIYGRSITIETPDTLPLPTFMAGTHRVRFVITNPVQNIALPEAIYFVRAERFRSMLPLNLVYPDNKSEIEYSYQTFKWEMKSRTAVYLIEFLEQDVEKPVFSAYTRIPEYSIPLSVLNSVFDPKKKYLWKVKGFDTDDNRVGESPVYIFTFLKDSQ